MRIAILGIRGIPANYGGFETFAEELAPRLVERGHDVTVYCRTNNVTHAEPVYKGVTLVKLPTISHKYLDTPVHTMLSVLHAVGRGGYDVILACNAANAPFLSVMRLSKAKVALNVDGIERLRRKWGAVGRGWYRIGEYLATVVPHRIVSDARVIEEYYRSRYDAASVMIPYGADVEPTDATDVLETYGLSRRGYFLYVSRFEPENNIDTPIRAFKSVRTDMPLVIVGDAPYATEYREYVHRLAAEDDRVLLTGFVYGEGYRQLQSHAYAYVQATEVGGTHPALVEAMGYGNMVIANGTPENLEVVADCAVAYAPNDVEDLARKMQWAVDDAGALQEYRRLARARVEQAYSWDSVTDAYETLFRSMLT